MIPILERDFPAAPEALGELRAVLGAACREAGCDEAGTAEVVLAVNEAAMNVIQHAYRSADGHLFRLSVAIDDDVLVVHLLDNGVPACDADLRPRPLDELRPGGLGVRFMREMMDEVGYRPPPPGYANCLELKRRIA